jgi:hypothetical protein
MAYVKVIGSRPCVALVCLSPRIWDTPQNLLVGETRVYRNAVRQYSVFSPATLLITDD